MIETTSELETRSDVVCGMQGLHVCVPEQSRGVSMWGSRVKHGLFALSRSNPPMFAPDILRVRNEGVFHSIHPYTRMLKHARKNLS